MLHTLACLTNEPHRLRYALHPIRESLQLPAAPHGWGLAYFQGDGPLLQQHPRGSLGPLDLYDTLTDLRSDTVLCHVAQPEEAGHRQPLRFRNWAFCHGGPVSAPDALRALLTPQIPIFLRRTDESSVAELLFYRFLGALHHIGILEDGEVSTPNIVIALKDVLSAIGQSRDVLAAAGSLNLLISNGRTLVALGQGTPLWMRRATGLRREELHPELDWDTASRMRVDHLRVITLLGGPTQSPGPGWEKVPLGIACVVSRNLDTTLHEVT